MKKFVAIMMLISPPAFADGGFDKAQIQAAQQPATHVESDREKALRDCFESRPAADPNDVTAFRARANDVAECIRGLK